MVGTTVTILAHEDERVQNRLPQEVPPWHVNYFERKANRDPVGSREMFTYPLKKLNWGLSLIRVIRNKFL